MDASEMSVEELEAALAAKRPSLTEVPRIVEVQGRTFQIEPGIEDSWEAVDFAMAIAEASVNEDNYTEGVAKAFALIEAATGYDRKRLYEACGAKGIKAFFQFAFELAGKCLPKN